MATWSLVTCLLTLLFAEAQALYYEVQQDVTTSGASGPKCGRRRCITNATCEGGKCKCPSGTHGNAHIQCVPVGAIQCTVTADPHLRTFGGARTNIALPCRYVVSSVDVNATGLFGMFSVRATNVYRNGNFYVDDVEVFQNVGSYSSYTSTTPDGFDQMAWVDFTPSNASNGVYNYKTKEAAGVFDAWGDFMDPAKVPRFYNYSEVVPHYDHDNNLATVSAGGAGGFVVAYRLYDAARARQDQLPGIAIQVPAWAVPNMVSIVNNMCGEVTMGSDMWTERARQLGLNSSDLAVIYEVLKDPDNELKPNPSLYPTAMQCYDAKQTFKASNHSEELLNGCGPLVTDKAMRTCVERQEAAGPGRVTFTPMEAFNMCLVHNTAYQSAYIDDIANADVRCNFLNKLYIHCGLKCPLFACGCGP